MKVQPIQVLKDGVLIPLEYLPDADEFEIEQVNGYVMVRSKPGGKKKSEKPETDTVAADSKNDLPPPRFSWIGSMRFDNPNLSVEVEDILEAEIDRRSGWTIKK